MCSGFAGEVFAGGQEMWIPATELTICPPKLRGHRPLRLPGMPAHDREPLFCERKHGSIAEPERPDP